MDNQKLKKVEKLNRSQKTDKNFNLIDAIPVPQNIATQKSSSQTEAVAVKAKPIINQPKKESIKYNVSDDEDNDLFDEDGNLFIDDSESQIYNKILELKEKIKDIFEILSQFIQAKILPFLNKIKSFLYKIFLVIVRPVVDLVLKILSKFSKKSKVEPVNQPQDNTEIQEEVNINYAKSNFQEMISLNIVFTDNHDMPFYNLKRQYDLTKNENAIIVNSCIHSINQCAEMTEDMDDINSDYYQTNNISEIMTNVDQNDIELFLGFIKDKPKSYIGQKWRISETFATWLINNAPMARG